MVKRAHGEEAFKTIQVLHCPKFLDIRYTIGGCFYAKHVQVTDINDGRLKQIGPFRNCPTDGDAAGTASLTCQISLRSIFFLDKIFTTGYEIFPGIGLIEHPSSKVPLLAILTTAANVGNSKNAAFL